ncbi:12940_t:CDS:2 [Dentiscutata heterogama]|uniref:12940_t:CDS:1 n=1 Tax=Dentiscutata heterogama TaxID=1316150 RepID=A0ACA9LJS8_9GLOM|nr:12940_t:CDS:2 [Dentiscutata heterogama]
MKLTLPSKIKNMCNEFVSSFSSHDDSNRPPEKLTHDETWKEYKEELLCIVNKIFSTIKDVWNNPALNSDMAGILNEGTYQSTVIIPFIRAVLKNLLFGSSLFISMSERESIACTDRKDGQMGRRPDIMFIVNHLDVLFEIMYVECSRLKEQFGIVEIQIAEDTLHLNVLIRDKINVHRYYNIESAKITVQESDENIITKFSPVSLALSVTPQTPIPLFINGQSDKDDSTNSVEQAQIESEKTMNKIHDQNLDRSLSLSKPSINSDSIDPFEYNYDLS